MNEPTDLILHAVGAGILAQTTTNLDNLLLALTLVATLGMWRAAGVFVGIQWAVIALAVVVGQGIDALPAQWIGYLGVIPLTMGLLELRARQDSDATTDQAGGWRAAAVLAANSGDSLAVMAVAIGDAGDATEPALAWAAAATALVLGGWLILFSRRAATQELLMPLAKRLRPWLMIGIGILILWDTPYDVA